MIMRMYDVLDISVRNLRKRKTRTILTIIGVMIGTTSIAVMMSIGVAMDIAFDSELSKMGSVKIITVSPHSFLGQSNEEGRSNNTKRLDDIIVSEISNIDGVEAVSPELSVDVRVTKGRTFANINLVGVTPSRMELFEYRIKDGRLLKSDDDVAIVFGSKVSDSFRSMKETKGSKKPKLEIDVLAENFTISLERFLITNEPKRTGRQRSYSVNCVGILEESRQNDDSAYININYLNKMIKDYSRSDANRRSEKLITGHQYNRVLVMVKELNNVDRIQKEISLMGFMTNSLVETRNQMKKTLTIIQTILGAIGAIAILVSALGITNTMYMSIFERNKEIGVIKVLGCRLADIRKMFLIEAGLIGLVGGLFGIGVSYIISICVNMIADKYMSVVESSISVIPFWLVLISIIFSSVVAVGAGYFPSRKAMKISALDAIRNE